VGRRERERRGWGEERGREERVGRRERERRERGWREREYA
jgi:hypothetical protein